MCGIVAALAYGEFEEKRMERIRQESMIFLTSELLQLTQGRGKDATGIATMFSNCDYMGLKMGISAQEFLARFGGKETDYEGYLKVWRKKALTPAKMVIGHCRKPSIGGAATPDDNKNNHPIKIGDIIGVHNGTLTNHEKIFTNLACKRDGCVDSEAIFRLLHHYTTNGTEPFTTQALQETCKRLSGSYAVLAFSGNNPFQLAAFRADRPLEIAVIKPLKLVLIASEKDFLRMALFRYNKMANLYQVGALKFLSLTKGDVLEGTLADDSLFLFDVRKEIDDTTKIPDLFITESIPRIDKIWVSSKTNIQTNVHTGAWNYNNPNSGVKKTQVAATNVSKTTTTTPTTSGDPHNQKPTQTTQATSPGNTEIIKRLGMAWNRSNSQYESIGGVNSTKDHGNIEIDCDENESTEIIPGKVGEKKKLTSLTEERTSTALVPITPKSEFNLPESEKPIDDLISDPAKISEVKIADSGQSVSDAIIAIHKKGVTTTGDKVVNHFKKDVVEVDLTTHPDVLEAAITAASEYPSFSNNDELADALQISDKDAMLNMEMYSLANRIKRFLFKMGWYAGYVARLNEEESYDQNQGLRNILNRTKEKHRAAQGTIRSMKTMTRVLTRILGQSSVDDHFINNAVEETFVNGEEIKSVVLEKAFKEGDFKGMPILRKIVTSINNKEGE
jgi:hypothetical protein